MYSSLWLFEMQEGSKKVAIQDQGAQTTLSDSFVEVNNTYDCNPISKCLIEVSVMMSKDEQK